VSRLVTAPHAASAPLKRLSSMSFPVGVKVKLRSPISTPSDAAVAVLITTNAEVVVVAVERVMVCLDIAY
jgi:hypothetical protein